MELQINDLSVKYIIRFSDAASQLINFYDKEFILKNIDAVIRKLDGILSKTDMYEMANTIINTLNRKFKIGCFCINKAVYCVYTKTITCNVIHKSETIHITTYQYYKNITGVSRRTVHEIMYQKEEQMSYYIELPAYFRNPKLVIDRKLCFNDSSPNSLITMFSLMSTQLDWDEVNRIAERHSILGVAFINAIKRYSVYDKYGSITKIVRPSYCAVFTEFRKLIARYICAGYRVESGIASRAIFDKRRL